MFNFIKKIFKNLRSETNIISQASNVDVLSIIRTIDEVADPFNADELWLNVQKKCGFKEIINEHLYNYKGKECVYSFYRLEIPHEAFEQDLKVFSKEKTELLKSKLEKLFKEDFNASRENQENSGRFEVLGAEDLSSKQVRITFGRSIYIPAPHETPAWNIEVAVNTVNMLTSVGKIYNEKTWTTIGAGASKEQDAKGQTIELKEWPFDNAAYLCITNLPNEQIDLNRIYSNVLDVKVFDDSTDQVIFIISEKNADADGGNKLYLRLTHLIDFESQAPAPVPVPVKEAENCNRINGQGLAVQDLNDSDSDSDFGFQEDMLDTIAPIFGEEPTPILGQLKFYGIAFQNMALYNNDAIKKGVVVALDTDCQVVNPIQNTSVYGKFMLNSTSDLSYCEDSKVKKVVVSESIFIGEKSQHKIIYQKLPPLLGSYYLGMMVLPNQTLKYELKNGVKIFGRLIFEDDIALRIYNERNQSELDKDSFGISRQHIEIDASALGLKIKVLTKNGVTAVVRKDSNIQTKCLEWNEEIELQHGDKLIVGHYVWHYSKV